MSSEPLSSAAVLAMPVEAEGAVPATVLDDSGRLGWSSVYVERWLDDPEVALLQAPVLQSHAVVFVTGGTTLLEERTPTGWRQTYFRRGSIGLNEAGSTRTLRWRAVDDVPIETAHIFLSSQLVEETAEAFGHRARRFPSAFDLQRPDVVPHARALEWGLNHRAPALYGDAAACTLIARLLTGESSRATAGAMSAPMVARLVDRMRADLASDLTLEELGAEVHLSRYHLVRSFKAATGLPPHAYLRRLRMEHATQLLRATDLPVASVAAACGYRSTSRFGAAFKVEIGTTPARYRLSVRQ